MSPANTGGKTIPIGQLELWIAYKLYFGAQKDIEDVYAFRGKS